MVVAIIGVIVGIFLGGVLFHFINRKKGLMELNKIIIDITGDNNFLKLTYNPSAPKINKIKIFGDNQNDDWEVCQPVKINIFGDENIVDLYSISVLNRDITGDLNQIRIKKQIEKKEEKIEIENPWEDMSEEQLDEYIEKNSTEGAINEKFKRMEK